MLYIDNSLGDIPGSIKEVKIINFKEE